MAKNAKRGGRECGVTQQVLCLCLLPTASVCGVFSTVALLLDYVA